MPRCSPFEESKFNPHKRLVKIVKSADDMEAAPWWMMSCSCGTTTPVVFDLAPILIPRIPRVFNSVHAGRLELRSMLTCDHFSLQHDVENFRPRFRVQVFEDEDVFDGIRKSSALLFRLLRCRRQRYVLHVGIDRCVGDRLAETVEHSF